MLIKAVAMAIPTYTMGVFRIPKSLCLDLQAMVAKFWWGGSADTKKKKSALEEAGSSLLSKTQRQTRIQRFGGF